MLKIDSKVLLLKVERKAYDFQGRSGVSTKASVIHEGTVFETRIESEELYQVLKDLVQVNGDASLEIRATRSGILLVLTAFKTTKVA